MDPFTIKPLDIVAVQDNAAACGGRVITVEDHYPEGGIGDAVLDAVSSYRNMIVRKLAVNDVPRSGKLMIAGFHSKSMPSLLKYDILAVSNNMACVIYYLSRSSC